MKTRHIKTFQEKYSGNVSDEVEDYLINTVKLTDKEQYDNIPYIGVCYIPMSSEFGHFWMDGNECDIIKNGIEYVKIKILSTENVVEGSVQIARYDDHNHHLYVKYVDVRLYRVEGNMLIHAERDLKEVNKYIGSLIS